MNTMSNIMWIELMDNESPCIYRFVYTREQLRLRKSSVVFGPSGNSWCAKERGRRAGKSDKDSLNPLCLPLLLAM